MGGAHPQRTNKQKTKHNVHTHLLFKHRNLYRRVRTKKHQTNQRVIRVW